MRRRTLLGGALMALVAAMGAAGVWRCAESQQASSTGSVTVPASGLTQMATSLAQLLGAGDGFTGADTVVHGRVVGVVTARELAASSAFAAEPPGTIPFDYATMEVMTVVVASAALLEPQFTVRLSAASSGVTILAPGQE